MYPLVSLLSVILSTFLWLCHYLSSRLQYFTLIAKRASELSKPFNSLQTEPSFSKCLSDHVTSLLSISVIPHCPQNEDHTHLSLLGMSLTTPCYPSPSFTDIFVLPQTSLTLFPPEFFALSSTLPCASVTSCICLCLSHKTENAYFHANFPTRL